MTLTAIVCTHNPRSDHIEATLQALGTQSDLPELTEFLLIDNKSERPLSETVDLSPLRSFAAARIIREDELGLTKARLHAYHEARGDVLLFVDDDNLLDPGYIAAAHRAMVENAGLGIVGGKSIPQYEVTPPDWFDELGMSLGCRDLGPRPLFADWSDGRRHYPVCSPIGAGMVVRRDVFGAWAQAISSDADRSRLGRRGQDLSSGEDNDLVLTALEHGWQVAYLPELRLTHLIPPERLTPDYLKRYSEASNRTWVQTLAVHGLRPWPAIPSWTVPLRKARSFFVQRSWRSHANAIRWKGACGKFAGQGQLNTQ